MKTEITKELVEALQELHNLLEENLPNWYLKSHHVKAKNALDKAINVNINEQK